MTYQKRAGFIVVVLEMLRQTGWLYILAERNWSIDLKQGNITWTGDLSARLEVSRMHSNLTYSVSFGIDVWIVQAMKPHSHGQLRGLSMHNAKIKPESGLELDCFLMI